MSNVLVLNSQQAGVGYQTYTYTVPAVSTAYPFGGAGLYNVQAELDVTNSVVGNGAGSGLNQQAAQVVIPSQAQFVINKNGTPAFTSPALTPFQTLVKAKVILNLAVADVVTVVFSTADATVTDPDNQLNTIKQSASINQGI